MNVEFGTIWFTFRAKLAINNVKVEFGLKQVGQNKADQI